MVYCQHYGCKKQTHTSATLDSLETLIAHTAAPADKKFTALADDNASVGSEIADLKTEMIAQFDHMDEQFRTADDRLRDLGSEIVVIHRRISTTRPAPIASPPLN